MAKIVRLVVLIVLVFAAYDYGWPWLQGVLESQNKLTASGSASGGGFETSDTDDSDSSECLAQATSATDAFGAEINQYTSPSANRSAWISFSGRVQRQIWKAESACGCSTHSCSLALDAMSELNSLISETDTLVRGASDTFSNPATRMERVYDLLSEAREAL